MTIILGIESSCDETGVGIVRLEHGRIELLADEVASSVELHARFGGVVPEVASRAHLEAIVPTMGRALLEALLAEARRRRVGSMLLEVAVDNAPAQKLYAAYGFEPIGVRRGYYQPSNTDALVMRCQMDEVRRGGTTWLTNH